MFTKSKRTVTLVAITTAACLCCLTFALAAKPDKLGSGGGGKGGGGGDTPLTGTVYFTIGGQMHSMNPDGSAKTPLPIFGAAEPSVALHGGHRWFLQLRKIAGEVYPDGDPRVELFAVRDDGNENLTVQLTNQPDLEVFSLAGSETGGRWAADGEVIDGLASWIALRWDLATGQSVEAGIYVAAVQFDSDDINVVSLGAQPISPIVELPVFEYTVDRDGDGDWNEINDGPDAWSFDWSPDTTMIVWDSQTFQGLLVADLLNVPVVSLPITVGDVEHYPVWSPTGSKIAFRTADGIETVSPDGSGRALLLSNTVKKMSASILHRAYWSPTGDHLVYWSLGQKNGNLRWDVYRAKSDGTERTNLTGDTDAHTEPLAWR